MITVIATFRLPPGVDRDAFHDLSEAVAPNYRAVEGLMSKHFLYDAANHTGGGFYAWESRKRAEAFHNDAWLDNLEQTMGSRPELRLYETAVLVDNCGGKARVETV